MEPTSLEVIGENTPAHEKDTVTMSPNNADQKFVSLSPKLMDTGNSGSPLTNGKHNHSIGMSSVEDEPFFTGKRSRMSSTLLSNYVLSISLLKNIAKHFTNPEAFQNDFGSYVTDIMKVEKVLYRMGSLDGYVNETDEAESS